MEDPELEEGEACYYRGDASIDPDITFSYIDEKLESVLGHFQKDFEGGVSAENLGAKFGGYGSFLPAYQRSPPARSHPKTPPSFQNHGNAPRSPSSFPVEAMAHKVPQDEIPCEHPPLRHETTFHCMNVSQNENQKVPSGHGLAKQDARVSLGKVEKLPLKHEASSSHSVNPSNQRPLRVKIKVCPSKITQKNAIYSGLGLISPSSSLENTSEESGRVPSGAQETPADSPGSILQIMTSFPVHGGVLLSPLCDDFLCMAKNARVSQSRKCTPVHNSKVENSTSLDDSNSMQMGGKTSKAKKMRFVGKDNVLEESKHETNNFETMTSQPYKTPHTETLRSNQHAASKFKIKSLSSSMSNHDSFESAVKTPEASMVAEKDVSVKIQVVNKVPVNNRLLCTDLAKNPLYPVSVQPCHKFEHTDICGSPTVKTGHQITNSLGDLLFNQVEHNANKFEQDSNRDIKHLKQNDGSNATSSGQDEVKIQAKRMSSEGKKKIKGRQNDVKLTENVTANGKKKKGGQSNKKLAKESLNTGAMARPKDQKISKKGACSIRDNGKDGLRARLEYDGNEMDLFEKPSSSRGKDSNIECVKQQPTLFDRSRGSATCEKIDSHLLFEALSIEATKDGPSTNGGAPGAELVSVAPVLIEENWVMCDRCQKWRLLPYGLKPDHLPDKWLCSMQSWLPGLNHCNLSQDETEKALRALYQLPHSESQSYNTMPCAVPSVGGQYINPNNHNFGLDATDNRGKKQHKLKGAINKADDCGLIQNPKLTMNLPQELVKRRSTGNTNQPHPETSMMKKSNSHYMSKLSNLGLEKPADESRDGRVHSGDKKLLKIRKSDGDQYSRGVLKKIKAEGLETDSNMSSEHDKDLGKGGKRSSVGLHGKEAEKVRQKGNGKNHSKDTNMGLKKLSTMKMINCTHVSQEGGSLGMKESSEMAMYTMKRKLKDRDVGTLCHNGTHLVECSKGSMEAASSDNVFRRKRKSEVPMPERKDSTSNKGVDGSNRKIKVTRVLLSNNRENSVDNQHANDLRPSKYKRNVSIPLTLDDIESLKRDLGSEQLSMTATSSSSKVSDLRKFRANNLEGKGSPMESVSSSPMRTFNLEKLSPGRMDSPGEDDTKHSDVYAAENPRKFLSRDGNSVSSQHGRRKEKASNGFQTESDRFTVLDFRDCDARVECDGRTESSVNHRSEFINNRNDVDTLVRHSHSPVDVHASSCFYDDDDGMIKNLPSKLPLPQKSGKLSHLRIKGKNKGYANDSERAGKKPSDQMGGQGRMTLKRSVVDITESGRHGLESCNDELGGAKYQISNGSFMNSSKVDVGSYQNGFGKCSSDGRKETRLKIREPLGLDVSVDEKVNERPNQIQDFGADPQKSGSSRLELRGVHLHKPQHKCQEDTLTNICQSAYGDESKSILVTQIVDPSVHGDISQVPRQSEHFVDENRAHQDFVPNQGVDQECSASSHVKKEVFCQNAPNVLKDAEKLRDYADRLKNDGFGFECKEAYFQAALKFLHGASLLETSNTKGSKPCEMSQMQIYGNTAKLCEICAREYEKCQEMAAATLAYKCMEVAYMKVIYCKNLSTSIELHDLRTSLQMVPQGDSPSSSASDLDNLNNQGTMDKTALSKGMGSQAGNHVIGTRLHSNFVRLLDFTKDVSSAMEASRKSQDALAFATASLEESQNTEGILSVKKVVDFSFQDVEEFVRLVRHAVYAISHHSFGCR